MLYLQNANLNILKGRSLNDLQTITPNDTLFRMFNDAQEIASENSLNCFLKASDLEKNQTAQISFDIVFAHTV